MVLGFSLSSEEHGSRSLASLGPDPARYLESIRRHLEAGFDHLYRHQVAPDQEGFIRFFRREPAPELSKLEARRSG